MKITNYLPIVIAAFIFASFGVFARLLSPYFGPFSQGIFRGLIVVIILLSFMIYTKQSFTIKGEDAKWFAIYSVMGFLNAIFFYIASVNLPLGTALFLFYSAAPIVSFIFAHFFLKDKATTIEIISLFLVIIGLLIIFNVSFGESSFLHLLSGLAAGAFFGLATTSSKKISSKYSNELINLTYYALMFIASVPLTLLLEPEFKFDIAGFPWMVAFSIVTLIALVLVVIGFKKLDAQKASLILLSETIMVTIIGSIFYDEPITIQFVIGAAIILIAMSLPIIIEKRNT